MTRAMRPPTPAATAIIMVVVETEPLDFVLGDEFLLGGGGGGGFFLGALTSSREGGLFALGEGLGEGLGFVGEGRIVAGKGEGTGEGCGGGGDGGGGEKTKGGEGIGLETGCGKKSPESSN